MAAQEFFQGLLPWLLVAFLIVAVALLAGYAYVSARAIWAPGSWSAAAGLRRYRQSLPWLLGGLVVMAGGMTVVSLVL